MKALQELAGIGWTPEALRETTLAYARKYGVPEEEALALLQVEGYSPETPVSPKGAIGPLQLMPGTAADLGVDPWNYEQNIEGGIRYYQEQRKKFKDPKLAYAAYNAGPGAVQGGRVPQNQETPGAVARFLNYLGPGAAEAAEGDPLTELAQIGREAGSQGDTYSENDFQKWYGEWARRLNLAADPDAPEHYYDYRGAFKAGKGPAQDPASGEWHWPSEFKQAGHPREVLEMGGELINTRTGKKVDQAAADPLAELQAIGADKGAGGQPMDATSESLTMLAGARLPVEKFWPWLKEGAIQSLARLGSLVEPSGLPEGAGMEPTNRKERHAAVTEGLMKSWLPAGPVQAETSEEEVMKGAITAMPVLLELMGYSPWGMAGGGAAIPFAMQAATELEATPGSVAKAGALGKALSVMHNLAGKLQEPVFRWTARLMGGASLGGGAAALEGAPAEEIGKQAAVFALFELMPKPGKRRPAESGTPEFAEEVKKEVRVLGKDLAPEELAAINRAIETGEVTKEAAAAVGKIWEGNLSPEARKKEMEVFAGESPKYQPPEPGKERLEGEILGKGGRLEPPEPEVIPDWTVTTAPSGKPINFKSKETAGKRAKWLNRWRGDVEARAVETPEGWRVEVRSKEVPPSPQPSPRRGEGEIREAGETPAPREKGKEEGITGQRPVPLEAESAKPLPQAPPDIVRAPVQEIKAAPEDFQFKLWADPETGAGLALKDVKKWDEGLAGIVTAWRSPEGELYVVNGHQRLELAKRTKTKEINARILDSSEWTKEEARAYGALINIAEGRGTAVDMAKFLRDTGLTPKALEEKGISLTEGKTKKALALKELSDGLFQETALGRLPEERAAIIGQELAGNHPAQEAIHRTLKEMEKKGQEVSNAKLKELLLLGKYAQVYSREQKSLFGLEELQKSLLMEQAELMAYAKKQLRQDRGLFGLVNLKKGKLTEAGNVIDPETNRAISREAAEALDLLDKAAYMRDSESNRVLNEFAPKLETGKNKAQIKANFYGRLKQALKKDRERLLGLGREAGRSLGAGEPEVGGPGPPGTPGARPASDAGEVRAAPAEPRPEGPRPPEVTPEQLQRLYPDISPEQAEILAQDPELREQFTQGNWAAVARQRAQEQVSDVGAQIPLEGVGGDLFSAPSPRPSPRRGEGEIRVAGETPAPRKEGTQAGKPAPPAQVPGLDAEPGKAVSPDPEMGPGGEIKLHSGGPDTAELARKLEERCWEGLAHLKLKPPGKYLKGRMGRYVPQAFMRQGFKDFIDFAYFPRWVAEKWEAFRPFYEGDVAADDVMANHRYEVWGKLRPYFRELTGAERRRVHQAALKLDRIKEADRRRAIEEEILEQGPDYFRQRHRLNDTEADAAHGLWDAYRYVRIQTIEAMKQDVVDLGMKFGLNEARAREFAAEILEKDVQGDYFPMHYSIMEFLPGREGMLYDVLTRQRENYQFWSRERALYMFPHTRWGPYWLHVWEKGKEGEPDKLVWAGAKESIGQYKKMREEMAREFAGKDVKFRESRREKVPMELYNNVDLPGLSAIMELARDRFDGEAWAKFLEAKQAFFAQKGWGSHKTRREDYPGFETENDKRVISDYFEGWIGMQGKTHRVRAFSDAWQGFKDRKGGDDAGLMKYAQNYVNYLLEHPYEASKIRRLLYHLYLGGSMGFRVLHGLHALQTAWPEMRLISKRPAAALVRAIRDRAQYTAFEQGWSKKPGLSGEELAALEQGRRKAALTTDYAAEVGARSASPLYRWLAEEPQSTRAKLKNVFDLIYYPTALDRATREAIFIGAVRELRGRGPITPGVIDRAAEIVQGSMYRYARGERPRFMRRKGAVATIFQTWSMKYFDQIFRYAREGQWPALGRLVAAAGMVGGLNALGVKDALTYAYRKNYGRDAEEDSKNYLQTVMGDWGGEALNRIMFRGLPAGVAGFDLSERMVHHLPWNYLFGVIEKPWQIAGAVTGPFEAFGRAGYALSENAPGRALEAAAPTWLRNPLAARRLYTQGPTTVSGRPILGMDFKQRRASLGEAAYKTLGMQPVRLSEEQGRQKTSKHIEEAVSAKVKDWASRYADAARTKNREEMQGVLKEWLAYNQEMKAGGRFLEMVTPQQFRSAVAIRLRPVLPEKSKRKTVLRGR